MSNLIRIIRRNTFKLLDSPGFLYLIVALLVGQAVWLVFSAIYPLPFDEFAHFRAIQIYAQQWSPFVTAQPFDSGYVGDMIREPSILYRWLMSFPYRILDMLAASQEQIIVWLRLMNVAMMAGSVILFNKLLLEWGFARRIVNLALLAFVMTPIVPFLAAHINYDNLMMLLAPLVLLYAMRLVKSNHQLIKNFGLFTLFGGLAVTAKQTFLPLMVIITLYVLVAVWSRNRRNLAGVVRDSWAKTKKGVSFVLVSVGIVAVGFLAIERYVGNVIKYGSLRPACETIHSVEFCEQFGPWYRNNVTNVNNRPAEPPYGNPLSFSQYWASRMMRGYFVSFSHTPIISVSEREPFGPIVVAPLLPMQIISARVVAGLGLAAVVRRRRKVLANLHTKFIVVISSFYLLVLWLFNYDSYLKMWKAEAIQARYTLPILILIFVLIAQAINWSIASRKIKFGLTVLFLLTYIWGGGVAGWIIRSDETWRWRNPTVHRVNQAAQNVLTKIVIY